MSIHVENLSFAYGDKQSCKISALMKKRRKYRDCGVSGCGKSTLLKLLAGLYSARDGIVEVRDYEDRKIYGKTCRW